MLACRRGKSWAPGTPTGKATVLFFKRTFRRRERSASMPEEKGLGGIILQPVGEKGETADRTWNRPVFGRAEEDYPPKLGLKREEMCLDRGLRSKSGGGMHGRRGCTEMAFAVSRETSKVYDRQPEGDRASGRGSTAQPLLKKPRTLGGKLFGGTAKTSFFTYGKGSYS